MRRIMLKLSGEALEGTKKENYSYEFVDNICKQIKKNFSKKTQIAIMPGGGNIIRGKMLKNIDKYKADEIGMLSTYMNSIYLQELLSKNGMKSKVYGAFEISDIAKVFSKDDILKDMTDGYIIILAGGTGHPYFTTDTGVVLRSIELECDELLLAKNIDGVYDKDPVLYKDAKKYNKIKFKDMIEKKLSVIDLSASVLCEDQKLNLRLFSLHEKDAISKAILGKNIGTLIYS